MTPLQPVLCLHGFTGDAGDFGPLPETLRAVSCAVAVPTLPGHDDPSGRGMRGLTADRLRQAAADALAAVRREAGCGAGAADPAAVVLGHSMGALLALDLAALFPEGVSRLVLVSLPFRLSPPSQALLDIVMMLGLDRLPLSGSKKSRDAVDPAVARLSAGPMEVPFESYRALADVQRIGRSAARRVTSPSLVLHGRLDQTAPAAANIDLAYRLLGVPPAATVVLERSAHLPYLDLEADRAAAATVRFLSGHP